MASQDFYEVHDEGDALNPGSTLKIERRVSVLRDKLDISELVSLPLRELERRREDSVNSEQVLFEQLRTAAGK
jgi:hypothetical protein